MYQSSYGVTGTVSRYQLYYSGSDNNAGSIKIYGLYFAKDILNHNIKNLTYRKEPIPQSTMTTKGDFSFISNMSDRAAYQDMYAAITKADAWEWMKYDPGPGGFIFNTSDTMRRIHANLVDSIGHSGTSFALFMRQMQFIARSGWDEWVKLIIAENTP
jgi:hypothetical protein